MSSNKCKNCGLVNKAYDHVCHRCGCLLYDKNSAGPRGPREAAKSSSLLYTLLAATLLGGAAYYVITGFEKSYDQIKANEAKRLADQPKAATAPLTSRTEHDRQRTEPYKNALANSPNFIAAQKRNEEAKRLMQAANQPSR